MERSIIFLRITHYITFLHTQVKLSAKNGLTDINVHAETFYRDLLNLVFGWGLLNMNLFEKNFPAIDLGKETGTCVQVTSTEGGAKVAKTLAMFKKNKLEDRFTSLKILVMGDSPSKKGKPTVFKPDFVFDPKTDIFDTAALLDHIKDLDLARLQGVHRFLADNISMPDPEPTSIEIATVVTLFRAIAESDTDRDPEFLEEPDPERKFARFTEHGEFLKDRFAELYEAYGPLLADVREAMGFTKSQYVRVGLYLKGISDRKLRERANDPEAAIEALVSDFATILTRARIQYHDGIIEFFLLDELIRCNVFPNRRKVSHA